MASLILNGVAIAPLGIGTWAWGDQLFWGYGKEYDAAALQEAFKTALELGIGFFDTAERLRRSIFRCPGGLAGMQWRRR
jgi:aryl-alcohol dehydrogenase-like predicted oxidoreductase